MWPRENYLLTHNPFQCSPLTRCRKLGTVIFPAFMLQKSIRARGMSKRFWDKATKKREQLFGLGGGSTEDIIAMYEKFCAEKEAYHVDEAEVETDDASVKSQTEEVRGDKNILSDTVALSH
jgi:hypothetical protein